MASPRGAKPTRWRLQVAEAMILLAVARLLVGVGGFRLWRWTLGQRDGSAGVHADLARAQQVGQAVARAAQRLPAGSRCLPRAMAAQWMLARRSLGGQLVIAVHRHLRTGEDAYHAWTESGGVQVTGHCVRDDYRPVLVLRR